MKYLKKIIIFIIRDLEINKLRKFCEGIFSFSKMSKHRLRTVKRMGCIFSIAGLRSKFLTKLKVKRASKMRRLLYAKSLKQKWVQPINKLSIYLTTFLWLIILSNTSAQTRLSLFKAVEKGLKNKAFTKY